MTLLGEAITWARPHALEMVAVGMLVLGMMVAVDRVLSPPDK